MAKRIHPIPFSSLATTGFAVGDLGQLTLHGWAFSEGGTAAGIVEFRTHVLTNGNGAPTPVVPVIGDDILFTRAVALSGDDSPWFDHDGIYLPGGLFLDLKTGTAVISGSVFIS